jgi:hypothetical protein
VVVLDLVEKLALELVSLDLCASELTDEEALEVEELLEVVEDLGQNPHQHSYQLG